MKTPFSMRTHLRSAFIALLIGVTTAACGVSRQQEVEIGRTYAAQLNEQLPLVQDRAILGYVNQLGQQIAAQGNREFGYTFYVVNSDVINAFALPGGYVYINRGIIEQSDNLAELAGVLAHEIGHVEERHSAEQIERQQTANLGLNLAYILLGRQPGQLEQTAIQVGGTAVFAGYSRDAENEADDVAVRLMTETGLDPTGLVTFFKELLNEADRNPSQLEQWFSTHPLTEERIANVRQEIDELNLTPQQLSRLEVTSPAYRELKSRMAAYPAPPPEYRAD